jgi:hypothetical protein
LVAVARMKRGRTKEITMEKQIKKIERNISIITKYIDEDDEDYDIE